jgi:hypothetical protein
LSGSWCARGGNSASSSAFSRSRAQSLLHELDAQAEGFPEFRAFLDMNIFLTAAKRADDVKGFLLQLALSRLHSRRGRDPLTGIAARTHPGKPDFGEILSTLPATVRPLRDPLSRALLQAALRATPSTT